jgi:pSer/pThr/pTyr-binding forkhead associated (FHA) protein
MAARSKTLTIGRGRDSDLLLTHSSISRRHAEITIDAEGGVEVRDLESSGGTYIIRGGKEIAITNSKVKASDTLRFGNYDISVKDLLSLVPEEPPQILQKGSRVSLGSASAGDAGAGNFKTRMMRCACGSIKERGKRCPDCGA